MDHAPGEGRLVEGTLFAVSRELDESVPPPHRWVGMCVGADPGSPRFMDSAPPPVSEASGPDRFAEIRSVAAEVFDSLVFDGPPEARPRAFGGGAFHESHVPTDRWSGFAPAAFIIPHVLVRSTDETTYVTVIGETQDEDALDRTIEQLTAPAGSPGSLPAIRSPGLRDGSRNLDEGGQRCTRGDRDRANSRRSSSPRRFP
ncbi:MAG: hypothetical protein U5K37_05555 [Natrialbaceae archaeon]|nr:hypothetical protein [Natrialbaceae archaeon]